MSDKLQALPTTKHYSQVMRASKWQLPLFVIDTYKISLLSFDKQKRLCKEINALINSYISDA